MKSLKEREYNVHQHLDMLVPLTKWKNIKRSYPLLHPTYNSALAATIGERLDGDSQLKQLGLVVLTQLLKFEQSLYEIPPYTKMLRQQLMRTSGNFSSWLKWLRHEEVMNIQRQQQ